MPNDQTHVARRSVLRGVGVATGVAALGDAAVATSNDTTSSTDGEAPAVTWEQTYQSQEREYTIKSIYGVFQADDEGYGVWGKGSPVTETGQEEEQFFLIRTDDAGNQQWIAFADDERENCPQVPHAAVQTGDGGYVLVGYGHQRDTGEGAIEGLVAEAAKVSPNGEIQWFRALDAFEDDETSDGAGSETGDDSAQFYDVVPEGSDGGFVAVGDFAGSGWFVAFEGDGSVRTERTYGDFRIRQVEARDDGFLLFARDGEDRYAVYADADGAVRRTITLDGIDYSQTPYNHVFVPAGDGGYGYTGRDDGRENMVLAELSEDGGREWRREYDGPGSSHDWAKNLVATEDGGYALGGYMSEAYSTDPVPAVVKTDADGAEQWRKLLTDRDHEEVNDFVETADGGYALLVDRNTLIKLAPEAASAVSGPGTPTAEETTAATGTTTESETRTSTGAPTSTTAGSGTETAAPTETRTDTETSDRPTTTGTTAEPATGTPSEASTQTGTRDGTSPSTLTPSTPRGNDEAAGTRSDQGSGGQVATSGQEGFTGLVALVALSAYALVRRQQP